MKRMLIQKASEDDICSGGNEYPHNQLTRILQNHILLSSAIAVMQPSESWVAKWQRIGKKSERKVTGCVLFTKVPQTERSVLFSFIRQI